MGNVREWFVVLTYSEYLRGIFIIHEYVCRINDSFYGLVIPNAVVFEQS